MEPFKFENLKWADARLRSITIRPGAEATNEVVCDVLFPRKIGISDDQWEASRIIFSGCVAVRVNLDFLGMALSGNTIADAACLQTSEMLADIMKCYEPQWLAKTIPGNTPLLHYLIELISPAGRLHVVGTRVVLERL